MSQLTWEEVIARDDIVGGDIETQEDGEIYRGPISKIELRDGRVYIETDWLAVMNISKGPNWKLFEPQEPYWIDAEWAPPMDIGQGRIHFGIPLGGTNVIFPAGGSKLDPNKVRGLVRAA